jgi:hypothetical protein
MAKTLLPRNIADEFKRLVKIGKGKPAKIAAARRWVYSRTMVEMTFAWWNENADTCNAEMDAMIAEVQNAN